LLQVGKVSKGAIVGFKKRKTASSSATSARIPSDLEEMTDIKSVPAGSREDARTMKESKIESSTVPVPSSTDVIEHKQSSTHSSSHGNGNTDATSSINETPPAPAPTAASVEVKFKPITMSFKK
jgi:hypothetical protein